MKLYDIIKRIEFDGEVADCEVCDIVIDSRKVKKGSLFVCLKGKKFDSHTIAKQVLENGACAVVCDRDLSLDRQIIVKDTRVANAALCQAFFGNPNEKLKIIGVTGTNGKTTVTNIIKQALENLGNKCGLVGTICCEVAGTVIPAKFTTPEPWDLAALMDRMVKAGCEYMIMEASSQGLEQGRLFGIDFDVAVFTNLTRDHLDYHGTFENYYGAKKLLFNFAKHAVINIDDDYGKALESEIKISKTTVSASLNDSDYTAKSIEYSISGVKFILNGTGFVERISVNMPGVYSVQNAMLAACSLFALGINKQAACEAVSNTRGVKGRCEVLYSKDDKTVICDFAHTGDALENLLSSIKPFVKGRMITLFGCAGDRDAAKRPDMARAVCRYSDIVVLTSDNPRTEDPMVTIDQIKQLIESHDVKFTAHPDRRNAVIWALDNIKKDDVLMLCGKGHEDYQVLDGCTIYFDEREIVEEYFAN